MPDGWTRRSLGELAEIRIGRTPPRNDPSYWTTDLDRPFCTITDMDGPRIRPRGEGVTARAESEGKAKRVPAGALLMSFKLTIGRVSFADVDVFPNEAIAWIRPRVDDLDIRYLALWLGSANLYEDAGRAVKGQTLNSQSLRSIRVEFPSLVEQRRIVDVISQTDMLRASAERCLEESERVRKAMLETAIASTDIARRPLRDLLVRGGLIGGPFGSDLMTRDYAEAGVPVINGANHQSPELTLAGPFQFVSEDKARQLARNSAAPGDVVATNQGTVGQVSLVPDEPYRSYVVSQRQIRARVDQGLAMPEYVVLALRSDAAQAQLAAQTISTAVTHINLGIFGDLKIAVPPIARQQRIVAMQATLLRTSTALRGYVSRLAHARQSMLTKLLSGAHAIPSSYDRFLDGAA